MFEFARGGEHGVDDEVHSSVRKLAHVGSEDS